MDRTTTGAAREGARPAAARISALSASTVLSAVSPLLYIPVVSARFGAEGWSSIAVGQSVGAVSAIVIAFGWIFDGARRLAGRSGAEQAAVLRSALGSQLYVAVPVVAAAPCLGALLAPQYTGAAALAAVAAGLVGLSPAWFFIGQGRAGALLLLDGLPKCLGSLLGVGLVLLQPQLWLLPAAQTGVSLLALLLALRVGTGRYTLPRSHLAPAEALRTLRSQRALAVTQLSSAAYINLPTVLVALVSPAAVATFAATDRLFRLGITALAPLTQFMQSWVPRGEDRARRVRVAVTVHLSVGVFGALIFALTTPLAQRLLFRDAVELSMANTLTYAALLPVVMLSQGIGFNVLALSGRGRVLAESAVCGAVVALVAIPALSATAGAPGAACGVLLAELAVLARQVFATRGFRRRSADGGGRR